MYAIHLKSKPSYSMFDGMPMVSVIFLAREVMGSKLVLGYKMFAHNIGDEKHANVF